MDYVFIRAWGRMLHSDSDYIEHQVNFARKTKAPEEATDFDDYQGRWHVVGEACMETQIDVRYHALTFQ